MIGLEFKYDPKVSKMETEKAYREYVREATRAIDRMGLFVEAGAVRRVRVNTGQARSSIYKTDAEYNPTTETITCTVGASAPHAIYIERGFQGHFVPFHVAEDLFYYAIRKWGYRIPTPAEIPPDGGGKRWLVPRGRKRAVWGVFIPGRAHPFLKPSYDELFENNVHLRILEEEMSG